MVVNCPNCDTPNDADMERCQSCNARIPMSLRRRAMIPKRQRNRQQAQFDEPDQVAHHADRRSVMHKTSDDGISRRTDARSLRRELQPRNTGMPTGSPQSKYAPPPTTGSAARSSSGRSYVDNDRYQASVGQGQTTSQPPNQPVYANRAAWEQQHGTGVSAGQSQHAQSSSAHGDPDAALTAHQQGQGQSSQGYSPQPQQQQAPPAAQSQQPARQQFQPTMPGGQQSFSASSGPAGQFSYGSAPTSPQRAADSQQSGNESSAPPASWQANQYESASAEDTARALASSGMSNPDASLQAHQSAPSPPSRRAQPYAQASEQVKSSGSTPAVADDGATRAMTSVPGPTSQPSPSAGGLSQAMTGESVIREEPSSSRAKKKRKPRAILVFIGNDGKPRERLPLSLGKTVIGRTEGEVLLTNDPYVSPWHAQVTVNKAGVTLKDMYSLNGIFKRIPRQAVLQDGDRFIIGNQVLKFRHGWDAPKPDKQGTRLLGGTNPSSPARVYVMTASEEIAGLTPIRDVLSIGRSGCDLSIPEDTGLADKHAQIQWDGANFLLIDLNSPTGVFLNIRNEAPLEDGDMIQIGRQRMMIDVPGG